MSLLNLKRKSPALEKAPINVEQFISQAEAYALGESNVTLLDSKREKGKTPALPKVNCTFSLTVEAKNRIDNLCKISGIPRSRLIRIWLANMDFDALDNHYLDSEID